MPRIQFRSRRGVREVEVRDVTGGHEHAVWRNGEIREIADADVVALRQPNGRIANVRAVEAIFNFGPDFVDADTGLNPNYTCSRCGVETLDEHFTHPHTLEVIPIAAADGSNLCHVDYIADYPEHEWIFIRAGIDQERLNEARARRADLAKPKPEPTAPIAPAPASKPAPAAPVAAAPVVAPAAPVVADAAPSEKGN